MTDQNELAIIATSMTSLNALAKVNKLVRPLPLPFYS